ncbi:MAG: ABC transporter substrate-binding protein [Candidatus Cloacimonetes bacterium]|nr:ABC transporter substrate-binding protein [Candidatus Cloacimonadota bacterium]
MKRLVFTSVLVLLILCFTACSKPVEKLRIGIIKPSIDHLPLSYALSQNKIDPSKNEIITFSSGWETQEALVNNQIDVAIIPFTYIWTARSKGFPVKTLSFFERETDGIVVSKSIKTVSDLNQKKVGVLRASTIDAFLTNYVRKNQISIEPVYFRTPNEMIAALKAGEVSAIVTYVPVIQKLTDEFNVLHWFSEDHPEHPCCNIAARENAIQTKYPQLQAFMNVINEAVHNLSQDDSQLIEFMKKTYLLTDTQAIDALNHSVFRMNLAEKDKQFELKTMQLFKDLKYIDQLPSSDSVYEDRFIRELP